MTTRGVRPKDGQSHKSTTGISILSPMGCGLSGSDSWVRKEAQRLANEYDCVLEWTDAGPYTKAIYPKKANV